MADDPKPPTARLHRGCAVWLAGEFIAALVGIGLAFFAVQANAPPWLVAAAFFGPFVLVTLLTAAIYLPRLVRAMREAARNAPSPESVAAAAHGAGVEAEAKPFRVPASERAPAPDSSPAVPMVPTAPGRVLAHRLERAELPAGCKLGCSVLAAAFWNGIVAVFVWHLVRDWNKMGGFRWFLAAFLTPFVLVGFALVLAVVGAALKWFVSGLVGRVEVELTLHPVAPGGAARLHVAQRGPVPLGRVEVRLVCTESATYVAGTSKSTATKEVARHLISDQDENPHGGLPLEFEFTVPPDAMHSFDAPNNKISWTVRVTGRVLGLPFRDDYSLAVVPGATA